MQWMSRGQATGAERQSAGVTSPTFLVGFWGVGLVAGSGSEFQLLLVSCSWGTPAAEGQLIKSWGATDYKDPTVHWGGEAAATMQTGKPAVPGRPAVMHPLIDLCVFDLLAMFVSLEPERLRVVALW